MGLAQIFGDLFGFATVQRGAKGRQLRSSLTVALLLTLVLSPVPLCAQTNSMASARPPARYLIVVETSRAMQRRAQGVFDAVKGLLDSSFQGQMHRGDILGIWTYNEDANIAWLPFEKWSPDTHLTSALRVGRFRQTDAYENRARWESVVPELNRVVGGPGLLTVVLVTSGETEIQGTPFDAQINAAFQQWLGQQQKANMPLLTLLRAKDGKITDWSVTPAPEALAIPQLPPEPQLTQPSTTQPLFTVTRRPKVSPAPEALQSPAPKPELPALPADAAEKTETATSQPPTPQETSGVSPERKLEQALVSPPPPTTPATAAPAQPAAAQPSGAEAPAPTVTSEPPPQATEQPAIPQPETKPAQVPPQPAVDLAHAPPPQTPPAEKPTPQLQPVNEQPRQEKPSAVQTAVTTPPQSLLLENAGWLLVLVVAGLAAAGCFWMWFRSYLRPSVPIVTLPEPGHAIGPEPADAPQSPSLPSISLRAAKPRPAQESFSLGHDSGDG